MVEKIIPEHARLLTEAREKSGMGAEDVAKAIGVAPSTYRNAERGYFGKTIFENLEKAFRPEVAAPIKAAWDAYRTSSTPPQHSVFSRDDLLVPMELLHGLAEARVTRFHPSRHYYRLLREGRASISDYISQATNSLEMVSIALATGMDLEGVIDTFEEMLRRREPVRITISLLDPEQDHLMMSIADVVGSSPSTLAGRIGDTIASLVAFRDERLSPRMRHNFELWAHKSLPNASAIIIDADIEGGLVQLETKGYKMGMAKSFGFEVAAPSSFFSDLCESYRHLIRDGRRIF